MENNIKDAMEQLNSLLKNMPYKLDLVDPKKILLLEKNARYMSQEMFQNLVFNTKRDGALSSLPLCYREKAGLLVVLSGNHRVQAAVHAGIEQILVLIIDRELTRQEQVAIQLSHNAIEGKDDPVILKELWDEIKLIDLKMYAGLDSEIIKELERMEFISLADARPDFKQIILLFLPEELEEIKKIMADIDMIFSGDENYILSRRNYEEIFRLIVEVKERYNIINNPTAFMKIIEFAKERLAVVEKDASK